MEAAIIIPARYGSSRFEGKPLARICGREMVLRVADGCSGAYGRERVWVATDSDLIRGVCEGEGYQVVMTGECMTGTDRVAEAMEFIEADVYVNVQGDEPFVRGEDIVRVVEMKRAHRGFVINGMTRIVREEEVESLNVPKVVFNEKGELLYISRMAVPGSKGRVLNYEYYRQYCIYGYSREELEAYRNYGRRSELEEREDIEILRFFEMGIGVKMVKFDVIGIAVDVREDVKRAEGYISDEMAIS